MKCEKYKCVSALLTIENEESVVYEWGINVSMDNDTVTFHQGPRDVFYKKSLIKEMELKVHKLKHPTEEIEQLINP